MPPLSLHHFKCYESHVELPFTYLLHGLRLAVRHVHDVAQHLLTEAILARQVPVCQPAYASDDLAFKKGKADIHAG